MNNLRQRYLGLQRYRLSERDRAMNWARKQMMDFLENGPRLPGLDQPPLYGPWPFGHPVDRGALEPYLRPIQVKPIPPTRWESGGVSMTEVVGFQRCEPQEQPQPSLQSRVLSDEEYAAMQRENTP